MKSLDPIRNFYAVPLGIWIRITLLIFAIFLGYLFGYQFYKQPEGYRTMFPEIEDIPGGVFNAIFNHDYTVIAVPFIILATCAIAYLESYTIPILFHVILVLGLVTPHGMKGRLNWGSYSLFFVGAIIVFFYLVYLRDRLLQKNEN